MPLATYLGHCHTRANINALIAMEPRHQLADLLAQHRGQRRRLRLNQHHIHTETAQTGSHLAADETGPHHHGVPCGGCMLAQCHALVERPEHPNAIKVGKRWNTPGHQTSRDDELVVAEHRTVGQRYRLFSRVQADGSRPQPKCDVLFVVELAGFEGHIVDLAAQHLLG
ncbi:Uncharacterised protein [Mycobacterium tuberculosis]|uniref:Uncharacterized protein n=1 Tax=Mycobacterium tuberculosis TaxID=1773 RepID=A0A655EC98_MYCTX|nr:Uncharacterised protein [Mycobacterium tuberculosis]CNV56376.1 Uncharacterised protein [Mycobacterium tuberculosis]COX38705.1 Uncharacterised protein [Mycobacterium tuberculosis]